MKKVNVLLVFLFIWGVIIPNKGKGQFMSIVDASAIAKNWITMEIDRFGGWGDADFGKSGNMQQLVFQGHLIAYYCNVEPTGYIIVSLRKESSPVSAYSNYGHLNPDDPDATDFVSFLSTSIDTIESRYGPIALIPTGGFDSILVQNKSKIWDYVLNYVPGSLKGSQLYAPEPGNYVEGEILLDCSWDQNHPYNAMCPNYGCYDTCGYSIYPEPPVGCVATAASQIMKYWSWPPYSQNSSGVSDELYDWKNMLNVVPCDTTYTYKAAVAYLCALVGSYMGMGYGCASSDATWWDAEPIYPDNYFYSNAIDLEYRWSSTQDGWWHEIKEQINMNRPIHYFIYKHSIVCDGWKIWPEGLSDEIRYYHMNYGWNNGYNTWWPLDELYKGNQAFEAMLRYIVPKVALGTELSGNYTLESFPYRYFDRDATNYGSGGVSAIFYAGQNLQFLPEVTAMATGSSVYLEFQGNPANTTRLYTNGDAGRGIKISNGAMRQKNGGTVKLFKREGH